MTIEKYVSIKNNQTADVDPVIYYYYRLKNGTLPYNLYRHAYGKWILLISIKKLMSPQEASRRIIDYVFHQLDKHFKL